MVTFSLKTMAQTGTIRVSRPKRNTSKITWPKTSTCWSVLYRVNTTWNLPLQEKHTRTSDFFHWTISHKIRTKRKKKETRAIQHGLPTRPIMRACFGSIICSEEKCVSFQSFHMYGIIGTAVSLGMLRVFLIKKFRINDFNGNPIYFAPKEKSFMR